MKGKEREETEGGEGGERRVGGVHVIQKVLKKQVSCASINQLHHSLHACSPTVKGG